MNSSMRLKPLQFALLLAFASAPASVWAAGPYPPLPPSLSTSVAPNIIFFMDTSGSMLQDVNNSWIRTDLCNPNRPRNGQERRDPNFKNWDTCVNENHQGFRTAVDSDSRTKMNIAKEVIKEAVENLVYVTDPVTKRVVRNPVTRAIISPKKSEVEEVRVGLFSFHDEHGNTNSPGRRAASILRAPVTNVYSDTNFTAFETAINALNGRTSTPLGEGLLEITQYLKGSTSLFGKPTDPSRPAALGGSYRSPIEYRCQKSVAIVITDGIATNDDTFPSSIPYTTADPTAPRDRNGNEIARSFSVCSTANTTPDNGLDVNCPAAIEGMTGVPYTTTGDLFNDGSNLIDVPPLASPNRFRALRDVAKYGRVADLRVDPDGNGPQGNDLDGRSFDDPKFAKQNLTTYAISLALSDPNDATKPTGREVLSAAAIAGGGKSYSTNNGDELRAAIDDALNSIGSFTSNAGGLATQSEISGGGNKLFQPVFNPSGWRGELRCFPMDANGNRQLDANGNPAVCTPNAIANIPTPTPTGTGGRNLFTSRRDAGTANTPNATLKFNFADTSNNYSSIQLNSLGATIAERTQTINYVRGVDIDGTRSRINPATGRQVLLGDIIDGQPLVVSRPSGATVDVAYRAFAADNASRNIVLIGANDGMLHAFRVDESVAGAGDNMREIMGYIPSAVYPNLKALKSPNYGTPAEPHTYHVNGSLRQADVKLSTGWTTVVAGGLGQGGQGYFALDVKNTAQLATASDAVKWEFTDLQSPSMGYSFGAPIIYNVRTSSTAVTPAVIVSNGYDSDFNDTASGGTQTATKASVLYIINAETGALIRAIGTNGAGATPAGWGGGLSSPAGVDVGNDGILDYVYAGDLNGKMWRFDLTAADPSGFFVATNPIFDAGTARPITSRPAVMPVFRSSDGVSAGNIVLFGTGKLLTDADRTSSATQYLYGILDTMEQTPTTVPNTVSVNSLQEQTITGLYTETTPRPTDGYLQSYRRMSNNLIDLTFPTNTRRGWRIPLPPTSGERNVSTPNVFEDVVFFATGTPISAEKCSPGSGWVMGLNPLTGSSVRVRNATRGAEFSFIDMNGDGRSNAADQPRFTTVSSVAGDTTTPVYASGFSLPGIPTELSFLFSALSVSAASTNSTYGDAGSAIALRESNSQSVYSVGTSSTGSNPYATPRPTQVCAGVIGSDSVECKGVPRPSVNAKVFSTIWREIKN